MGPCLKPFPRWRRAVGAAGLLTLLAAVAPAPEAPGEAAVTDHLIFVDDYFGIKHPRNQMLGGIRDQLSSLPPRDRVAVVAFDGRRIDVLTPWTSEPEEVRKALDRAAERPTYGLLRANEKRRRGDTGPWSDIVSQEQELRRVLTAVRSTLRILPRPGLHVRARSGFEDVSRAAELDLMAESALRLGDVEGSGSGSQSAAPEAGGLRVAVGDPQPRAHRTMAVKLRVDLPWREVTLVPAEGGLVGQIEIRVAARDRDGTVSEVARVPVPLKKETPPAPGKILRWEADLTLRRERNDLVVSVYDGVSGQVRTQRVTVEP